MCRILCHLTGAILVIERGSRRYVYCEPVPLAGCLAWAWSYFYRLRDPHGMSSTTIGQFLFLLLVANGAPIIAQDICQKRLNYPIDGGKIFYDGRPLFGSTKTVRGVLAAGVATGCAALLVGRPVLTGVGIGLCAMCGDLVSSFIK